MADPAGIAALPAGRDLDVLIATHVLQLPRCDRTQSDANARPDIPCSLFGTPHYSADWYNVEGGDLPGYSTDAAAAMEVIERLRPRLAGRIAIDITREGFEVGGSFDSGDVQVQGEADTLPLAICRMALAFAMEAA